ncbi:MAG: ABC transporter permease [Bacteroidales bacterium]|nr:ABC transporter permease [Bacteroidales bacterium]
MITDQIEEIYVSMSRNKLRIALTGFSIAWGIFMLIVLLGAGNGLLHGMEDAFASQAINTVSINPGWTSQSFEGLRRYREMYLDSDDLQLLRNRFPNQIVDAQPSYEASVRASYGLLYTTTSLMGVYPEYMASNGYKVVHGRGLNEMDLRDNRKVCMITAKTGEELFADEEPHLGEWINLYDIPFQIVGIYKAQREGETDILSPITTVGTIYKPNGHFSSITFVVKNLETPEANEEFNNALKTALSASKRYDPEDRNAYWVWNTYEDYLQTMRILRYITLFIWLIGIATLIAGVTGISNIMLITVRERTREFGIRKALGARPWQIVSLVLLESVAIALVFGYIGMLVGTMLTKLVDTMLKLGGGDGAQMFKDPTVDFLTVLMATLVMVIAGVIAGYIPAKRAVSIKPVEALAAN